MEVCGGVAEGVLPRILGFGGGSEAHNMTEWQKAEPTPGSKTERKPQTAAYW